MAVVPEVDVDLVSEHGVGLGLGGMKGEGLENASNGGFVSCLKLDFCAWKT